MTDSHGKKVPVTATRIQLFPGLSGRYHIRFENLDATDSIYVGDSTVTEPAGAAEGAEFNGGTIGLRGKFESSGPIANPENIWAVCAAGLAADVSAFAIRAAD